MCRVSWSLKVKRPRTSMTFERCALKWPCVSRHVSSSFKYSFWMKVMWEVINSYNIMFGLETQGKDPEGPTNGPWGRTHVGGQNCPKAVHLWMAIDVQWPGRRPIGFGHCLILSQNLLSNARMTREWTYAPSMGDRRWLVWPACFLTD